MVKKISIGIIGIQGAISEHINSIKYVLKKNNIPGNVFIIKNKDEIKKIDGLLIPGGESTTISKIMDKSKIFNQIMKRIDNDDLPIMGTCAGCVLLSTKISDNNEGIKPLSAIQMQVKRNAFGRQKDSFETNITINGLSAPYKAIFIRAPIIEKIWGKCELLSKIDNKIVMARQNNYLAITFHPELTEDIRIHKYFLDMILRSN